MKLVSVTTIAAGISAALFANIAMAAGTPSAKFAATYTTEPSVSASATIDCATTLGVEKICTASDSDTGHTLARIKVPQDKELLVGVSAEIGLTTFGAIKGKNGGSGSALADASVSVSLHACPIDGVEADCVPAEPGGIKLAGRVQELSAKLGGVIKDCTFTAALTGQTTIDISTDCTVTDEEIALLLDTVSSNHFNFVFPNMDQGVYDIKAVFTADALAEVRLCDDDYTTGSSGTYQTEDCDDDSSVAGTAEAASIVNKTMVTVQTVRAAKGGIVEWEIEE